MLRKLLYIILGCVSFVYLVNPTAGIFELIPDNIPLVGNLDEFAASALLIKSIRVLIGKGKGDNNGSLEEDILDKKL